MLSGPPPYAVHSRWSGSAGAGSRAWMLHRTATPMSRRFPLIRIACVLHTAEEAHLSTFLARRDAVLNNRPQYVGETFAARAAPRRTSMNGPTIRWWTVLLPLIFVVVTASSATAQGTTAAIGGLIVDETGPLPDATIVAKDALSGFTYQAVSDAQGAFNLSGLRPATYEITVSMPQYKPQVKTVQVLLGQTVTTNFKIGPDVVYTEAVQVVGSSRLVETKTSEVSTSVTTEQVRYLPQNQRNFLNFAALAPGARVSNDETRKQVTGGGLDATQINVFIDGVSYKNDVLDGGVVGQASSRGSPFPQNAVQEFRVVTQNFKTEYEKASSAVITALTKSGTNRWAGDLFLFYQNKSLVSLDKYSKARNLPKP